MRAETEEVQRSVQKMKNFQPTPQGSAIRTPGPQFMEEIVETNNQARIFPYLTPANERSIVVMTPDEIKFIPAATKVIDANAMRSQGPSVFAVTTIRRQIVENNDIKGGIEPWLIYPENYTSPSTGASLGLKYAAGGINGTASNVSKNDIETCLITGRAQIPKLTQRLTVAFALRYMSNFQADGDYDCRIQIGTTLFGNDLMDLDYKDLTSGEPGSEAIHIGTYPPADAALAEGSFVWIHVFWTAKESSQSRKSTPRFELDNFSIWANDEVDLGDGTITGTVPYNFRELKDVHFVQSPLIPYESGKASKELVFTHPNHPPQRLWFDSTAGQYKFEPITFIEQPAIWGTNNYPATCTSYNSRLVLAGGFSTESLGSPISGATETVWTTEVGKWDTFTATGADVTAADSVIFTSTYRSPIQWVYGQKDLLVGALEMEYVTTADGVYQPADLGVFLHSSHGSSNVQPAGFGETVMFPAEGGTKVRSMNFSNDDDGWVAPDLTILHPELCSSGIKRMVRMRNPHQMLVVLLKNGQLALLHYDRGMNLFGWSRINLSAAIRDICVMSNEDGIDILFATIVRNLDGAKKLYLEAFTDWSYSKEWTYLSSYKTYDFAGETSKITGLEHVAGQFVQVIGNTRYLGTYLVSDQGEVELRDQLGNDLNVSTAVVGMYMESVLQTLPIITNDPKGPKRFSQISARIRESAIPMIGAQSPDERGDWDRIVERPQTRATLTSLDRSTFRYELRDVTVANTGWGSGQSVFIVENIPQRTEIIGIFGKLTGGSL